MLHLLLLALSLLGLITCPFERGKRVRISTEFVLEFEKFRLKCNMRCVSNMDFLVVDASWLEY